jgi:DNA processing protein
MTGPERTAGPPEAALDRRPALIAGPVDDEILLARAYLCRVAEPACIPVWDLVRRAGPVQAASAIRRGDVPPDVAAATSARCESADPAADLDTGLRHGMRLVVPESREWPHFAMAGLEAVALRRLASYRSGAERHRDGGEPVPPLALWVKGAGDLVTAGVRGVAMVGSRAATGYGEQVTADLSYGLAVRGFDIVSGGAYGIDAAAHRAALAADGQTILVSAGGLQRPYPPGNARLYERVAESGLVVSESPPGAAPQRHRFLTRNRLIATLSAGTLVIEAAARSGALNTAYHCRVLGRMLMAVPGPIMSPMSAGCHALLRREGAERVILVAAVDHVLDVIGAVGEGLERPAVNDGVGVDELNARVDQLDPRARRVFDGVPVRRAAREDELAWRCGLPVVEVIRALPALRLVGLVESTADGFRLSAAFRKRCPRAKPP